MRRGGEENRWQEHRNGKNRQPYLEFTEEIKKSGTRLYFWNKAGARDSEEFSDNE